MAITLLDPGLVRAFGRRVIDDELEAAAAERAAFLELIKLDPAAAGERRFAPVKVPTSAYSGRTARGRARRN